MNVLVGTSLLCTRWLRARSFLLGWAAGTAVLALLLALPDSLRLMAFPTLSHRVARLIVYAAAANEAFRFWMDLLGTRAGQVLSAEWYRALRSRVIVAAALFLAAIAALRIVAAHLADQAAYADAVRRALSQGRAVPAPPGPGNAWGPFVDGWLTGLTVATLLLLIASARSLAGDRESGLLRVARTRVASRVDLVLGRALVGAWLVLGALVATGAGAWLAALALFRFGPVMEGSYEIWSSLELHAELRDALKATLPPLLATWAFGLCVSSLVRSGTAAVSAALAVYLGFDLFKEVLGPAQYRVFAAFNPSFVDNSCLHEMSGLARGLSDAGYSEALYAQNLWLPWPWAAGLLLVACLVMRRRAL
jgi:hypothetical protein